MDTGYRVVSCLVVVFSSALRSYRPTKCLHRRPREGDGAADANVQRRGPRAEQAGELPALLDREHEESTVTGAFRNRGISLRRPAIRDD